MLKVVVYKDVILRRKFQNVLYMKEVRDLDLVPHDAACGNCITSCMSNGLCSIEMERSKYRIL